MRIAHLADIHLGYQAYNRVTSQGVNRRQADVFKAFREAVDKLIEIKPDAIIIAGDLFHSVRPSNLIIRQTYLELRRLRSDCPAEIVLIGGNHDSPRSADTGCILDLFDTIPGINVVVNEYKGLRISGLDAAVFCLPHRTTGDVQSLRVEPDESVARNVLTLHGTLEGIDARFYDAGRPITSSQIALDRWDYVALGHYHVHTKMAENAYYCGSLEFTSSNIWQECGTPKGFLEVDLDDVANPTFHVIGTRDVVDLRALDAAGLAAGQVDAVISERIEGMSGGHQDKIVRLVVENISKTVVPDLDYGAIRRYRTEALHLDLSLRPERRAVVAQAPGERSGRTLEEEWKDFASEFPLAPGLDREKLVARGIDYLADVEQA